MTSADYQWDVIIIGAGPAGSNAAFHLARKGWKVLMLEKQRTPGAGKACGGQALSELKQTLSLPARLCEKEIKRIVISSPERTCEHISKRALYLSFRRKIFDDFLAQRAVRAGTILVTAARVKASQKEEVTILDRNTGRESIYRGKIIIYADGVPTLAWGQRRIGFSPKGSFHEALVYELEAPDNVAKDFHFHLSPGQAPFGCFWIFPKQDMMNVGLARLHGSSSASLKALLDEFRHNHPLTKGKRVCSARAGMIPARLASEFHTDNCMVVGDAAGFTDPVTGGGIQPALNSGELAARAAHAALGKRQYDAKTLALYPKLLKKSTDYLWIRFWGTIFKPLPFLTFHIHPQCYAQALRLNFALGLWLYKRKQKS